METIPQAAQSSVLQSEIDQLTFHNLLASKDCYEVFVANASQIPNILKEIGRLREITFREVGEGTGNSVDLDSYDLYYQQLFIWDKEAKKIVGGYRIGEGDKIFEQYGEQGFYIHSLFKIKKGFYNVMRQSVELGRSYIIKEYQKKRLPLFLLWKGILYFLIRNRQFRYLYGPVSISKRYSNLSKSLIVEFVKTHFFDATMAQHLTPRNEFKLTVDKPDMDKMLKSLNGEMKKLDNLIHEIELGHFKIPILMKQYVRQNAKFISFNVDPNFSDALDGFMMLDLKNVPYATIEALQKED